MSRSASGSKGGSGISGLWVAGPVLLAVLALLSYWAQPGGPTISLHTLDGQRVHEVAPGQTVQVSIPTRYSHALLAAEVPPGVRVLWPTAGEKAGPVDGPIPIKVPNQDFVLRVYLANAPLDRAELASQAERLRVAVPVTTPPR